ncbi:hypothetical protein H5410_005842, partial [Solanum commersonii]
DDVDLLEMYLISGNVGKHFVIASRSLGRTPLTTPSKSYVAGVVAFSNCRMLVEEFFSSPLECHNSNDERLDSGETRFMIQFGLNSKLRVIGTVLSNKIVVVLLMILNTEKTHESYDRLAILSENLLEAFTFLGALVETICHLPFHHPLRLHERNIWSTFISFPARKHIA